MLSSIRTSIALAIALGIAVLLIGIGMANDSFLKTSRDDGVRFLGTASIYASEVGWATDERFVVGAADDVFVGRVIRTEDKVTSTTTSSPPVPESQFSVEVVENVKGDLDGTVTVNQSGGIVEYSADRNYPEEDIQKGERVRQLSLVNGIPLFEPGQKYLFVTTYDDKNDWHELVTSSLAKLEVEDREQRDMLVSNFEDAKQEQVDPEDFSARSSANEPAP